MSRFIPALAGVAIVAALIGGFVWFTWENHIELRGEILKIRTHGLEDNSSIAVLDFRFANPARFLFVVRDIDVFLDARDGKTHQGMVVAEMDLKRLFAALPLLGPQYNDPLKLREKIAPKTQLDRMVTARFEVPESVINARARLRVKVREVDGNISELVERSGAKD